MMVAICTPSRGLIYSRTVQSIVEGMQALNKLGVATKYFYSHDLPIPDGHNFCVEQAFQDPAVDKIFFVEEDMYIDPQAFVALATSEHDFVTLQYNDKNGSPHGIIHYNEAGEVLWSGLGATCIKREVFEKVGQPYFRTNIRYGIKKKRSSEGFVISEFYQLEQESEYQYGGLDIDLCTRVRTLGIKLMVLPEYKAHHFQLVQLGEPYTNNGCHVIKQV